ncbi:MAG: transcription termination/antitermination protein NusG [Ginsengibacter sp.]
MEQIVNIDETNKEANSLSETTEAENKDIIEQDAEVEDFDDVENDDESIDDNDESGEASEGEALPDTLLGQDVPAPAPEEKETKWYVLRVVSGKERKTKEYLDKDIIRNGWDKIIKQVFLPVEKVYKVLNGKKVMRERNFYPGYIMIEVADGKLSDEIIQHLSNISNVMHFLTDGKGSKGNIICLRKAEVNKMLGKVDEMAEAGGIKMSEPFIVGETIKIIDGPFNDFNGVIEEVNDEKKKLKVQVKIFGRATPVELNYMQVEKLG